ncbi:MAG: DNA helicase [Chloroflexi bacterium]|nr:DNA helicase [Chloroflexota bacterium]
MAACTSSGARGTRLSSQGGALNLQDHYEFRSRMVDYLATDVLGPSAPDEILDDAPLEQYVTGILYPCRGEAQVPPDPAEDLDAVDDDFDSPPDPPVSLANRRYPSSMGLTFAVDTSVADTLSVQVEAALYEEIPGDKPEAQEGPYRRRFGGLGSGSRWRRIPRSWNRPAIRIDTPGDQTIELEEDLELFVRVRVPDAHARASVTVVVVNRKAVESGLRDAAAYFQARLEIRSPSGPGAFVPRPAVGSATSDADVRSYRLLYRHAPVFAVGHGCSATWDLDPDGQRAAAVRSTFTPEYELPLADSNPDIDASGLSMLRLSSQDKRQVLQTLRDLAGGFEAWVAGRGEVVASLGKDDDLRRTADEHLESAAQALGRMRAGIELLDSDDLAWQSFLLANRAMLVQRARTEWLQAGASPEGPSEDDTHRWRPFQLAFILLNLPGLAQPASDDRRIVDLLWFPTGGGKTEAYLGLIAFTTFLRRLRNDAGGGVTALMRYTLRLLTIQQFQRASMLIVACEYLRRRRSDLGRDPISIGLWVGRDATPLTRKAADDALSKIQKHVPLDVGSPMQVHQCPWCGRSLGYRNYYISKMNPRLVIACMNDVCEFGSGLPIFVVDEDVYAYRPTLLIATVDKFASLPWREDVSSLFNIGHPEPPPELIIQDEFHLISGPLGTLTGLYETVVDELASRTGIPPKVIASTATIRRAADQALAVFGRPVRQFPPPGIDSRDSYFAVERPADQRGTRLYLGLSAPGVSQTTLMIRVYAALLQAAAELPGPDDARDPYWTLVGYFNSLRVLGAAEIQVRDDVEDRVELLARRSGHVRRHLEQHIELTSRAESSRIPQHLSAMAISYPDPQALDVILATNMISVGVDVDRLGLMVVMGQPQATSEYIQATSRVGRQHPGLVVTLLNAAKSRDRSHYEAFVTYHSALYRQVEATSVTPFSPRARDRALHAVFVALARLSIPSLRPNAAAGDVDDVRDALDEVIERICDRVRVIDRASVDATREQLTQIRRRWEERADQPGALFFQHAEPSMALLGDASQGDDGGAFPTMWSLRDVDAETHLYLE